MLRRIFFQIVIKLIHIATEINQEVGYIISGRHPVYTLQIQLEILFLDNKRNLLSSNERKTER